MTNQNGPACPHCGRPTVLCDPSHELAYWTCPAAHEPPGVVLPGRLVDSSFALAHIRIRDQFDTGEVDVFEDIQTPRDVPGLVTDIVLERLESSLEFKRMRQRRGHDEIDALRGRQVTDTQTGLDAWAGGQA